MSKITIDRSLLENVTETLEGMVNANWRNWEELSSPEEFERWVKSRANFVALALREALAQPGQEPVAWMHEWHDGEKIPLLHNAPSELDPPKSVRPLVFGDTAPPARRPLTDEEIDYLGYGVSPVTRKAFARAIEGAHGIKDTP